LLGGLLQTLLRRNPVESLEVFGERFIKSHHFVEDDSQQREAVQVFVDLDHLFADVHPLMLHRKETIADVIETICLNQGPRFNDLGLTAFQLLIDGSLHGHPNDGLVVDELVKLSDLKHFNSFLVFLVVLVEHVNAAVAHEGRQHLQVFVARLRRVDLQAVLADHEEGVVEGERVAFAGDVGTAEAPDQPVQNFAHFSVVARVHSCDDQDGIDVAVEAELLDADHSVAEVLARVEPVVVRVVVDAEDLLPRRNVRRGHRVREHFLHLLLLLEVEGGELRLVLFVAIHGS